MPAQVVTYELDESTLVKFEMEPAGDFRPAGPEQVIGRIRDAVDPAVEAAKAVLDKIKEAQPDQIELKFGIKVSGATDWLIAKAASEANFEVTLLWQPKAAATGAPGVTGT